MFVSPAETGQEETNDKLPMLPPDELDESDEVDNGVYRPALDDKQGAGEQTTDPNASGERTKQ